MNISQDTNLYLVYIYSSEPRIKVIIYININDYINNTILFVQLYRFLLFHINFDMVFLCSKGGLDEE